MPLITPTGKISTPALLWCEGPNDFAFFRRMLGYLGIPEQTVRIEVFWGKNQLPAYLTALPLRPGFSDLSALGIVRDADDQADGAFRSVSSDLAANGLVVPSLAGELLTGRCLDERERTVGVFIAPDGHSPGALEGLYLHAIGGSAIRDCAREFVRCTSPHTIGMNAAQLAKVEFHAWLSACEKPGILPGQAMDANYIDRDSSAFDAIKDFLVRLAAAAGT